TMTPASAKDQFVVHFSYEVGLVSNDLGIHTPYTEERRLDLFGGRGGRAEYSSGCRNERLDGRNIGKRRLPDPHGVITRIQRVRRRHSGQCTKTTNSCFPASIFCSARGNAYIELRIDKGFGRVGCGRR